MGNEPCFNKANMFKRMGWNRLSATYVLLKHKGKFTASVGGNSCEIVPLTPSKIMAQS